jgi:uncharacterized protein
MYLTRMASLHRLAPDTSLLVNALSGAVDLVNDELRAKLLELGLGGRPAFDSGHLASLIERGYVHASEGEERAALIKVYGAYQRLLASRPLQFVVCPTYGCNLACAYCFEGTELPTRHEVMTGEQVSHLFSALGQLSAAVPGRQRQLVLFGGEPLLPSTEAVIGEILRRAGDAGLIVQIVTNGTHVVLFAPTLSRHRENIQGLQITLDGPRDIHDARRNRRGGQGSFDAVVQGVEQALEIGLEVNVRVNLDAHNLPSLPALVEFMEMRGWVGRAGFQCQLAPVTDHLGTSPYPHRLREDQLVEPVLALWRQRPELRKTLDFHLFRVLNHLITVTSPDGRSRSLPRFHYCEADRGEVMTFGPDGLIYPCPETIGNAAHAVGVYSPRYRLWQRRLKSWQGRSVMALPECQGCNIATFCGGGCAYAATRKFGSPGHGFCADAPAVVSAYIRFLRKQFANGGPLVVA